MHKSYQKFAKFYDAMHQRRNYQQETAFVVNNITERFPQASSVLDVGCGTGTHLQLLSQSFSKLDGVDLNQEILEVAQAKCPTVSFHQAGMADFTLDHQVDAITCLYSVFNYNLTLADAQKTLENFHRHLNSNGVLIVALYRAKNLDKKVSIHVGKFDDVESAKINDYVYDPKTQLETSSFVLFWKENGVVDFETENNHQFRIFEDREIEELLTTTGFTRPTYYHGYTDTPATPASVYPVLVTQKSN